MRFPEFTEEWKKCTIKDYGEVITGNTPPTKNIEYYSNGSYLWASPADLGLSKHITSTKTKLSLLGLKKTRTIPQGSILVTCIGSTIGKMGMATETMSTNQQINSVIVNDSTNNDFAYYAILNAFPRYLSEVGVQAVPILSKSNFEKLPNHTTTKEEQRKLGYFLNLLDERIATQNKIIEKLQSLIKGIRNNMMSQNHGDCIALQYIADIYQPKTIPSTDLTEDGYLVYGANGIIGKYHLYNHEKEQICITCRGNTCGTVNYTEPKSWITGNAMVINTDNFAKNVNKRYLFHYLSFINFNSIISGSGQPQIVRQPLAKLKLILPKLTTQEHIAKCLDTILAKIKNEQTFLQAIQIQKSYLLSQMFI